AEKQHRAELRIDAAADYELISIEHNHRLDANPLKMLGASALANSGSDGAVGMADCLDAGQVELDAADVGLMGYCAPMELKGDRESNGPGGSGGGVLGRGNPCFHRRDPVAGEDLLRLDLGQEDSPLCSRGRDDRLGSLPGMGVGLVT